MNVRKSAAAAATTYTEPERVRERARVRLMLRSDSTATGKSSGLDGLPCSLCVWLAFYVYQKRSNTHHSRVTHTRLTQRQSHA